MVRIRMEPQPRRPACTHLGAATGGLREPRGRLLGIGGGGVEPRRPDSGVLEPLWGAVGWPGQGQARRRSGRQENRSPWSLDRDQAHSRRGWRLPVSKGHAPVSRQSFPQCRGGSRISDQVVGRPRLRFPNAAYAAASKGDQLPTSASWCLHAATVERESRARCTSH